MADGDDGWDAHQATSALGPRAKLALSIGAGVALGAAVLAAAIEALRAERKRRAPLRSELWNNSLDPEGKIVGFRQLLEKVRHRGVEPGLKASVWPFLLQLYDVSSTASVRAQQHDELSGAYRRLLQTCERLDEGYQRLGGSDRAMMPHGLDQEEIDEAPGADRVSRSMVMEYEAAQRIIVLDAIRADMAPLLRMEQQVRGAEGRPAEVEDATAVDEQPETASEVSSVWTGQQAHDALGASTSLGPEAVRMARRLVSVLSAYSVHDPEVGYCQGMADLAAPFVAVMADDSEAFWCFERLMSTVRGCFVSGAEAVREGLGSLASVLSRSDPVLMHKLRHIGAGDCLFAYRMLLVRMRRELSLQDCVLLWEMLWAEELLGLVGNRETGPPPDPSSSSTQQQQQQQQEDPSDGSAQQQGPGVSSSGGSSNAGGAKAAAAAAAPPLASPPDLFVCFLAEVTRSQRRPIIDGAQNADDVLRVFGSYKVKVQRTMRGARRLQAELSPSQPSSRRAKDRGRL